MKNIKVLLAGIFYRNFTGSEMYLYEVAKNLSKLNCDVSIFSPNLGNPLMSLTSKFGVKFYNTTTLSPLEKFDIIHCQHQPIINYLIQLFPETPKICTIHSEIIDVENPIKHHSIKKYISIREGVTKHLTSNFGIPENDIAEIFNPVDNTKFNKNKIMKNNFVLFVGSFEHLRRNAVLDLVEYCKNEKKDLWLVGENHSNYIQNLTNLPFVKYFTSTENVQDFVKNCSETAGIMMGRTTIEGWMCGKPGWIYNVDKNGLILNKNLTNPPDDIEKFYSKNVTKQIINEYKKIIL